MIPLVALACWWCSAPLVLALVLPLAICLTLDVFESRRLKKAMAEPHVFPPETSARNGRERLEQMMPAKTGKRYLVVGTGGVGRRLIQLLQQRGETQVYGFDVQEYDNTQDNNKVLYFKGDVTSFKSCQEAIQSIQPEVVFHTAAVISYSHRKKSQWPLSFSVNVEGVLNMLKACTEHSTVQSFILTSSSTAGVARSHVKQSPIHGDETMFPPVVNEQDALSWYTRSKALAEQQALEYCATHAKAPAFAIIRPASGIFHHLDPFSFIPAFRDLAAPAIGFEYVTIDWVFNDNVVLGHLLLEAQLNKNTCRGQTFLITNREPVRALDVFRRIRAVEPSFVYWRMPSTLLFFLASFTEIMTSLGLSVPQELSLLSYTTFELTLVEYTMDDTKARKLLEYEPAFSLDEAILQMMENHRTEFPDGGLAKAMRTTSDKKQS